MNEERWAAMSWVIGYGYMYGGVLVLHLAATIYFFITIGFAAALLAFFFPILSTLAAAVVSMIHGNYAFLLISLAYVLTPPILVIILAVVQKTKKKYRMS